MPLVVVLAILLPLGISTSLAFQKKFEETVGLVFFLLIGIGYAAGVLGWLSVAVFLVYVLTLCSVGYIAYYILKNKKFPLENIMVGVIIFSVLAALLWWVVRGRMYSNWDEFSHWGKSIKITFFSGSLYSAVDTSAAFQSYPPATTVLQYLFLKVGRFGFREDITLFINALFAVSLLIYPIKAITAKEPCRTIGKFFLAFALFIMPFILYTNFYTEITVDGLLGVLAAYLILTEFLSDESWFQTILLCAGIFTLTIMKTSGFGLAAIVLLVVYLKRWLLNRTNYKQYRKTNMKKYAIQLFTPILALLAAKFSWSFYLQTLQIANRWETSPTSIGLLKLFNGTALAYQYEVVQKFFSNIFTHFNYGGIVAFPFAGWGLVFAVLFGVSFCISPKEKRNARIVLFISVFLAVILFTAALLYSYLFIFTEYEALVLASLSRYLGTALLIGLICLGGVTLIDVCNTHGKVKIVCSGVVLILVLLVTNSHPIIETFTKASIQSAQTQHDRYLFSFAAERIRSLGEQHPLLYLITPHDAGKSQMIIEYELYPVVLPTQISIIGTEPHPSDIWMKQYSAKQWSKELAQKYNYVYIYVPEDQFVKDYVSLFEDESQVIIDKMFEVIVQPDGAAKLRLIPMEGHINDGR